VKAMLLEAPAPVETAPLRAADVADEALRPGEVRLEVHACGVCRTDLHTVEGEVAVPHLPVVPGHQIVGVVTEAGPGVSSDLVGRRVGVAWMAGACGTCAWCLSGRENLCPEARFTGVHRHGGYAEHAVARADFVYTLPDAFDDVQAAPLLCAGVIGYRALRLAGALAGGRLGIFGFGASAHIALQVAKHARCEVFVFTRAEHHIRHALSLGAAWAGAPEQPPPAPLDRAVIFSPAGEQVPLALRCVARGGTVACAGVTMSDVPSFPYSDLYHERTVRSVANATRADARELLQLAVRIPITTSVEVLALERANEALLRVKRSAASGALVLCPA